MAQDDAASLHSIIVHPLADLSNACAPLFVNNLKLTFMHGKGKSGVKFHELRKQITISLPTVPPPGPATFVLHCLETLLFVEPPYNEGLSHLLTSALNHLNPVDRPSEDAAIARKLAASLFYNAVVGTVRLEARIIVRLVVVFGIQLKDVWETMPIQGTEEAHTIGDAKAFVELFVFNLIKTRSYNCAVSLLKQFDLQECASHDFLITMASDGQPELAGQWAAHLGKDMICFLVQRCTEMGMFKNAHKFVQHYQLQKEFPDAYYLYRQSSLRKLVGKGLWDVAESIADEDSQLPEYLATLALEKGDATKAAEICDRFHLKNFPLCPVVQKDGVAQRQFIQLTNIISEEKVMWVDDTEGLAFAAKHMNDVNVVGIDCEWKSNRLKGAEPNKVAILQVATPELVFIFDLINLSEQDPASLDKCIKPVFHSPVILKLGYAVHNDLERLLKSYQDLECFHTCESVLDLQKVAGKRAKGGLSGLAKVTLGSYLDKQTRMSNWEERPLSVRQLHYAALDAAVLLSIFDCICTTTSSLTDAPEPVPEWKQHVMSFRSCSKNKKATQLDKSLPDGDYSGSPVNASLPSSIACCAPYEDLVSASCELVGLPTPGLLKTELLNLTQAARLPPPVYRSFSIGPEHATIFYCTVKVAGLEFSGCPAFKKKEAAFWAAQTALTSIHGDSSNFKRKYHLWNTQSIQQPRVEAQHASALVFIASSKLRIKQYRSTSWKCRFTRTANFIFRMNHILGCRNAAQGHIIFNI